MGSFRTRLALVALLGLAVRLLVAWNNRDFPVVGDALTYHLEGGFLAHGEGFRRAYEALPTAEHPPAHIVLLGLADLLGLDSTGLQKAFMGVVGTVTVVLVGLLGRRVGGPATGLVAAGLAAVHPMLWLPDAALMSETTSTLLVVATMLLALRLHDRRTLGAAALLGAAIALTTLARGEAIGLLVLLAVPVVWAAGSARGAPERLGGPARVTGSRVRLGLACAAAFLLVLAPWSIRNATTFERPVLLSTNGDAVWVGANCPDTYFGANVGSWAYSCFGKAPPGDESQQAVGWRKRGLDYAQDHTGRIPVVAAARLGRLLDVYRPWTQGVFYAGAEGRQPRFQRLGLLLYWLLLPFGIAGAVLLLRRRRAEAAVLLAPVALVLLVGVLVYGSTRFRTAAEPSLVVCAAVALEALRQRVAARRA